MGILANENAIETGGYNIANSLRFQSASSQSLSRTPASSGSQTTYTYSAGVKRGALSSSNYLVLWSSESSGANYTSLVYYADAFYWATNGTVLQSTAVYRDTSAWYHIVLAVDTTQATSTNRVKIYVNGSQVSLTGSYPTLNQALQINTASFVHKIGFGSGFGQYFDGYMTEFNFVDGQALTPSSFGETDTLTGQWVAKKYTGTYGTNGFYLPFSNGTSTTTLGADSSGNGNNWTLTNFTRSAGTSDCWMYDVPSGNGSAGTQPNSNYAVINPLNQYNIVTSAGTVVDGNLKCVAGASANSYSYFPSSIELPSDKIYFECVWTGTFGASTGQSFGIGENKTDPIQGVAIFKLNTTASIYVGGSSVQTGLTWNSGDVFGIAYDGVTNSLQFYRNGTTYGTAVTPPTGKKYFAAFEPSNTGSQNYFQVNFGQRSFAYTPPSGFKALCTANLPTSTIVKGNQYMDATLYTGNGSTQTITNAAGFSPDLVWTKSRSTVISNTLYDTIRGVNNGLFSNATNAETSLPNSLTAFNSNGFSLGSAADTNTNGSTYVAWQWDAGSSTVTNTNGTISSQVRANPTAGVSVVTFTGTGANATVGHGLGVAPSMIITKRRNSTGQWGVYNKNLPAGYVLLMSLTNAAASDPTYYTTTLPTSSVYSLGTTVDTNASGGTYVSYCFSEIAGFSKFGSYTGNGSADGSFVYLGFRPKYILVKNTGAATNWDLLDSVRDPYNLSNHELYPNLSNAEDTGGNIQGDFLSNGFKLRGTDGSSNGSGSTYIYMAFAENPFAQANAR